MRIHVLSAVPLSDEQKARLSRLGEMRYWDETVGDPTIGERVRGAEILVVTARVGVDISPYLDGVRMIAVQATGTDAFPLEECRRRDITVCNVPEFSTEAVAEHAFALLLAAAKRLEEGRPLLQSGRWTTALAYRTLGLKGRTLGLFGCGKIGARIAEIGRAFGMEVVATVRDASKPRPVPALPFSAMLAASDYVVLAAPATPETVNIFDAEAFARMKPGAVLVNVSRGALVVDADLIAALDAGRLAAAATDVFRQEPPDPADPLVNHPRIFVSPHVAWGVPETVNRALDIAIDNVEAFLAGRPQNVVV